MKKSTLLLWVILCLIVYFGLNYYGGVWGRRAIYPLRLLVTFFHELGHALAAVITGGSVDSVQINADGSGWTRSSGGNRAIIIFGGYFGSALFGNMLFYMGARGGKLVKPTVWIICVLMLLTAVYWFNSLFTSAVLTLFAIVLYFISQKTKWANIVLLFLGLISIVYIIQDFNVGPRSDLEAYADEIGIFSPELWMYIWLFIVVLLCFWNFQYLLRRKPK